jgi:hypothetical protein
MVALVSTFYKKLPDEVRSMTYSKVVEAYTYMIYHLDNIKEGINGSL